MPDFRSLFEDRIAPANFMSLVMSKNFDTSLLASLQILSDVIVHLIPSTNLEEFQGAIPYTNKNEEISITITSDESSLIFQQIDAQSQRMAKLNQEISIAMNKIH